MIVFTQRQAVGIWLVSAVWGAAIALLALEQTAIVAFFARHQL